MSKNSEDQFLKFNFDVSAYRLLGRELITDRITALFELVKNAYDANANNVTVEFISINPITNASKIIITDDGLGMDMSDLRNRWMVIGTSSKRRERTSPAPYNRKVSGKKGVGRFAVDKLGSNLTLKTKKKGETQKICLETNWVNYSEIEQNQLQLEFEDKKEFFTDIKNKYWFESFDSQSHGTMLEISAIDDVWKDNDIKRAYKELSKLVAPTAVNSKYPFNIKIISNTKGFENILVKPNVIQFATNKIELIFNPELKTQQILQFKKGELLTIDVPERACGPIKLTLYYFDKQAKDRYKSHFDVEIDGIKIYRDGVITTPFAEYVEDQNEQKDILGIDKRRYSGFFDKLSSRDVLGFIEITDENNPMIIESTNRQGFVDNKAWEELKKFLVENLIQFEKYLTDKKKERRATTKLNLTGAGEIINEIKVNLKKAKENASPDVIDILENITLNLSRLQGTVTKSIKDYNKLEEETKEAQNLFFSLVSLQTFAAMFSHMAQHTIGHIIRDVEYFSEFFPNEKLNDRFLTISRRTFKELINLRNGVEFMLKYAKSDTDLEDVDLENLLEGLFFETYASKLKIENIDVVLDIEHKTSLHYNRKALEDIFDNLISNSIKALKSKENKTIHCKTETTNDELTIYFSDNGEGISEEDKFRIFDVFFTKTASEGGSGMGLFMVKTRIEAMQGDIQVIESELKPSGATFKITLPFNK